MTTINRVELQGRLGRDPEVRYTASGSAVVSMSIATDRTGRDAEGKRVVYTDWHRVIAFGDLAKNINGLQKGDMVRVLGQLQTRSFNMAGEKRYVTEVKAVKVRALLADHRYDEDMTAVSDEEMPF